MRLLTLLCDDRKLPDGAGKCGPRVSRVNVDDHVADGREEVRINVQERRQLEARCGWYGINLI
jgi:hypothetical protein